MAEVWRQAATVDEVTSALNAARHRQLSRKTVLTVLTRLEAKGLATHTKESKAYRFQPTLSEAEFVAQEASRAAEALLGRFGALAVSGFVDQVSIEPTRLAQLEALLEERREGD